MNQNSETRYIFGTENPKPGKDKGILWATPLQEEVKCLPPPRAKPLDKHSTTPVQCTYLPLDILKTENTWILAISKSHLATTNEKISIIYLCGYFLIFFFQKYDSITDTNENY